MEVAAGGQAQRVRAAHGPPGRGSTPRQPPDTHCSKLYMVSKCCSTASAPCARKAARKAGGRDGGREGGYGGVGRGLREDWEGVTGGWRGLR